MKLRPMPMCFAALLCVSAMGACNLSTVEDLPSGKDGGPMAPNAGNDGVLPGLDSEPEGAMGGMGGMGGANSTGGPQP